MVDYTKKNWVSDETIPSTDLQNLEDGVEHIADSTVQYGSGEPSTVTTVDEENTLFVNTSDYHIWSYMDIGSGLQWYDLTISPSVSDSGTPILDNVTDINFTDGANSTVDVSDDGDGTVSVNVSSTDTDTTYDAGSGLDLTSTTFSIDEGQGIQTNFAGVSIDTGSGLYFSGSGDSDDVLEVDLGSGLTFSGNSITISDDLKIDILDDSSTIVSGASSINFGDGFFDVSNPTGSESKVSLTDSSISNSKLENDSVSVAGNSVSLGGTTNVNHSDLSNIDRWDHHEPNHTTEYRGNIPNDSEQLLAGGKIASLSQRILVFSTTSFEKTSTVDLEIVSYSGDTPTIETSYSVAGYYESGNPLFSSWVDSSNDYWTLRVSTDSSGEVTDYITVTYTVES